MNAGEKLPQVQGGRKIGVGAHFQEVNSSHLLGALSQNKDRCVAQVTNKNAELISIQFAGALGNNYEVRMCSVYLGQSLLASAGAYNVEPRVLNDKGQFLPQGEVVPEIWTGC